MAKRDWMARKGVAGLCAAAVLGMSGCASVGANDPLEPMNRAIYGFNRGVDKALLKPVAAGYAKAVPKPVRQSVGNVFGNLDDVGNFANALLQGKLKESAESLMRVAVNTVFGIGGLFDVASSAGIPKADEDFGQTLGKWGVGAGPYVVLPIFGPSSLRDAASIPVDCALNPACVGLEGEALWSAFGVKLVQDRSEALGLEDALEASLDEYAMRRDFYVQRREALIRDGAPDPKGEMIWEEDAEEYPEEESQKSQGNPEGSLEPDSNPDPISPDRERSDAASAEPPAGQENAIFGETSGRTGDAEAKGKPEAEPEPAKTLEGEEKKESGERIGSEPPLPDKEEPAPPNGDCGA